MAEPPSAERPPKVYEPEIIEAEDPRGPNDIRVWSDTRERTWKRTYRVSGWPSVLLGGLVTVVGVLIVALILTVGTLVGGAFLLVSLAVGGVRLLKGR